MANKFQKSRLDNGMTLVTESLPQFQSLSIGAWVNAGTRHELPGEEGMSHFLEHMMFKGTVNRSALDIAQEIDRVGGEFNAFTTREYTCFHLLLLSRDVSLAVEIMSDVLLSSLFATDEIERERKVILQEISMVEDNPEELLHDLFFEQAFGKHPLGKPILGTRETVSSFDQKRVLSYFNRHYTPSQMVISIAGNVSHGKARKLLNKYLAPENIKGFSKGTKRPNLHLPMIHPGVQVVNRDLEQAHVVIGFPGMSYASKDRFAGFLLNTYLGGGMSSSLFQEIREKRGLAYSIYTSMAPFSDTGLFSVYVGTSPDEVMTCLDVTGKELVKLRQKALDERSVKILKDNLKGTILLNSDSVESRMTSIAKNEMFFGKYYSTHEVTKAIDKVTTRDIQRLANKIFDPKKMLLTVMGPLGKRQSSISKKLTNQIAKHF